MQEENPSLKNHTYYIKKLKAQNLVKNLPLVRFCNRRKNSGNPWSPSKSKAL
jgi:hypothetical protein